MKGTYTYTILDNEGNKSSSGEELEAELGMFHFVFPAEQRVKPVASSSTTSTVEEDEDDVSTSTTSSTAKTTSSYSPPPTATSPTSSSTATPPSIPGDDDIRTGKIAIPINDSSSQSIQLLSRRFEIQTISSEKKDVVQGPGVTGRQPILKPGESFEYTSTAPLNVKPLDETPVVARMSGEYNYVLLDNSDKVVSENMQAKLGMFHFVLPQLA